MRRVAAGAASRPTASRSARSRATCPWTGTTSTCDGTSSPQVCVYTVSHTTRRVLQRVAAPAHALPARGPGRLRPATARRVRRCVYIQCRTQRAASYSESQRPLTRYLPVDRDDFDLRRHVESAGVCIYSVAHNAPRPTASPPTHALPARGPGLLRPATARQVRRCVYIQCRTQRAASYSESQRPLTRYLPVDRDDFDLRRHVKSAGVCIYSVAHNAPRPAASRSAHSRATCPWTGTTSTCDGTSSPQVIEEVYLDHGNTSKSPSPQTTFIVKTRQRRYYLMAPSGEAARIWIDAIFTGAQGYTEYLE
ncbi:Pleckstrin [Operophtera brumata]|uniref:Pleckstrin n=1 Tax=Operophtera brumata TaxID=104452 RepID=A0A0L7LC66_OPEBR|nr:Pleckstrin [Operophtera brumata]